MPAAAPSHAMLPPARVADSAGAASRAATPIARKLLYATPIAAGLLAGLLWHPEALRNGRSRSGDAPAASLAASVPERPVFAPPEDPEAVEPAPRAEESPAETAAAPPAIPRPRVAVKAKRLVVPAAKTRVSVPEPKLDVSAPELQFSASTGTSPAVPPRSTPLITATVEPVRASGLRRAVGSIPGLGFLKRRKNPEAFVPPRPIRQFQPTGMDLGQDSEPVRVKVTVDPAGEVAAAQVLSRNIDPEAARAAVDAARKWRFEPARIDDKPVSAELVLRFASTAGSRGI